jgi:hypothetical protein
MKSVSKVAVALGLIVAAVAIARTGLSEEQSEKKAEAKAKLERLRKERIETLEKFVELAKIQYKNGAGPYKDLVSFNSAQEELVEVKLEATDKTEERIALLKEQLKIAQQTFDYFEGQRKAGFLALATDPLRAKAHCLKIEIELAKEEAKAEEIKSVNGQ